MIKAIIFDCFGVLTTDHWKEFCAKLPPGKIVEQAKAFNHDYDAGQLSSDEFVERIYKLTGRRVEQIETKTEISDKNYKLLQYITTLKPQYKIGLLSNIASNWVRDTFLTPKEQKLFDDMTLSFEVGMTKPDHRIYRLACERLNVRPKETILIDDINHYCQAAKEVGLKTVVYEDFIKMKQELEKLLADPNN